MDKKIKDTQILKKMLSEIDFLLDFVKNETLETIIDDEPKKRVVSMTLLNLGELAYHLSDDLVKSAKDIPFKSIINLRNKVAHGYHALDFSIIWLTIKDHVPTLKIEIGKLLK